MPQVGGLRFRQGQRRDVGQRGRDRKQEVRGSRQRILRLLKFVQRIAIAWASVKGPTRQAGGGSSI